MGRSNGGIIGADNPATANVANGIFSLNEQGLYVRKDSWPSENFFWAVIMATSDTKSSFDSNNLPIFANPGNSGFRTATAASTGASARSSYGDGQGVYDAFFNLVEVEAVALTDGTGILSDPTTATNYAIYEPDYTNGRETTGSESLYDILLRIDTAFRNGTYLGVSDHSGVSGDSQVEAVSPGMTELVGGINGYSAKLTQGSGSFGGTTISGLPDNFCVWGENFDSDHDSQALCFYDGTLELGNGKGDDWRRQIPTFTAWSYWGRDLNSSSVNQTISESVETPPGANTFSGTVYVLAFGRAK